MFFVLDDPFVNTYEGCEKRYQLRNWLIKNEINYKFIGPTSSDRRWRLKVPDDVHAIHCKFEWNSYLIYDQEANSPFQHQSGR